MSTHVDRIFDDFIAVGQQNRETIELARRHCTHMEFREWELGGRGMAEAATGLPINTRRVHCAYAPPSGSAAMNLDWVASEFYKRNCRGCPHRRSTGELPNLATIIEAREAELVAAESRERKRFEDLRAEWNLRVEYRRTLRTGAEPPMQSALDDLGLVDSDPTIQVDADAFDSAVRRLVALADRAPNTYSTQVIEHMSQLAEHVQLHSLASPLRHVARSKPEYRLRVVATALNILRKTPSVEAARCLVEFSTEIKDSLSLDGVIESLIMLAGQPELDELGHPRARSARNDPSGLRVAADREPEAVKAALRRFLRRRSPPSALILPAGLQSDRSNDSASDSERCTAARAIRCLASSHAELAMNLINELIASVSDDEEDMYGLYPVANVQRTLAVLLLLHGSEVMTALERAGEQADNEYRDGLFDVIERACQLLNPDYPWHEPEDPVLSKEERQSLYSLIISRLFRWLDGAWGIKITQKAATLIENLATKVPDSVAEHIPALLGALLATPDSEDSQPSNLVTLIDTPSQQIRQLDAFEWHSAVTATAHHLTKAIKASALTNPGKAFTYVDDVLQTLHANDSETKRGWRLLSILGEIGSQHGDHAGLLRRLLPTLYTYMLHSDPWLRATAIKAWTTISENHSIPSSLSDLIPALINDPYLVVIEALLDAAVRLEWSERDTEILFYYTWRVASNIPSSHKKLFKKSLRTARILAGDHRTTIEAMVLQRAADLDGYDLKDVLQGDWLARSRQSPEMARLQLRLACDPRINDRINSNDQEEFTKLLDCGVGLVELLQSEVSAAAMKWCPEYPYRAAEFAEILWRAGRPRDAAAVMERVISETPDQRVYASRRAIVKVFLAALHLDADLLEDIEPGQTIKSAAEETAQSLQACGEEDYPSNLAAQVVARIWIRCLLAEVEVPVALRDLNLLPELSLSWFSRDPSIRLRERAAQLAAAGQMLSDHEERRTATGAYIRAIANLCDIGSHLLHFDAAELSASDSCAAHLIAAQRRAATELTELRSLFGENDPIAHGVISACERVATITKGDEVHPMLSEWATLPIPLLVIHGTRIGTRTENREELIESEDSPSPRPVAVVLAYIDDRLVTGPQVLRPRTVYTLRLDVNPGDWPDWAARLDAEIISHLSPVEAETPTFTWSRLGPQPGSELLRGEGTLILRFGLAAGQPAPPFRLSLHFRGQYEGIPRQEACDIAGHRELRLRPFDPSRDALTSYPVVDERLLAIYEDLHGAGYNEEHVQAFCRLLTAVCRAGLAMTWEKRYKQGQHVREREFHDDLHARLLADPELGGRVERNEPLALGYLDIRHDGITAELKVERKVPVTEERAPKYMGQPTQYAAADGVRLSILCILDMSQKERPVGTPENYLWRIQPALHGLTNPESPSLVTVVVVNGNLPVPSAWPRKRTGSHTTLP